MNEENQWSICNLYYFICLHVSCFPFRCVFYQIAGHIFHGSGIVQCAIKQISFSIWFFIYDNCETVTDIRRKIPSFQLTIAWLFFFRVVFEDARQFSCALQFYKMDNCLHPEKYIVRFAIFYTKMRIAIPIICAISICFHEIQLEIWTCENSKPTIFFSSERKSELSLLIQLNARTQHIRSLACSFSIDFRFSRIPQFNDRKFHFVQPRVYKMCFSYWAISFIHCTGTSLSLTVDSVS